MYEQFLENNKQQEHQLAGSGNNFGGGGGNQLSSNKKREAAPGPQQLQDDDDDYGDEDGVVGGGGEDIDLDNIDYDDLDPQILELAEQMGVHPKEVIKQMLKMQQEGYGDEDGEEADD
jgi:hypothetical protein